jgi:hypothetical protein
MNKLIAIGFTGTKRVYLNITKSEAIERYIAENSESFVGGRGDSQYWRELPEDSPYIEEFTFDDSFDAYAVWPIGGGW